MLCPANKENEEGDYLKKEGQKLKTEIKEEKKKEKILVCYWTLTLQNSTYQSALPVKLQVP